MAAKSPAAQSGVFVVDLSGLNLPKSALDSIERAINATVQKQVGSLDLRSIGGVTPAPADLAWHLDPSQAADDAGHPKQRGRKNCDRPAAVTKLCPSYRCGEDALLIGVVQPDDTVAMAAQPFAVSRDFIDAAGAGREPETRFRFAGACVEQGCAQWKKGKCGIPDRVRKALADRELPEAVRTCAIRADCRWFAQDSYAACRLCPLVITQGMA